MRSPAQRRAALAGGVVQAEKGMFSPHSYALVHLRWPERDFFVGDINKGLHGKMLLARISIY